MEHVSGTLVKDTPTFLTHAHTHSCLKRAVQTNAAQDYAKHTCAKLQTKSLRLILSAYHAARHAIASSPLRAAKQCVCVGGGVHEVRTSN